MTEERKPDFVEIDENHVIATRGIMSIKQAQDGRIEVRYISGYMEQVMGMTMPELLSKLGRLPEAQGSADRDRPPTVR